MCLALSSQVLPEPLALQESSISTVSRVACRKLLEILQPGLPWRLHVLCANYPGSALRASRAQLVEQALLDELKKSKRAVARERCLDNPLAWRAGERLVQLALVRSDLSFLSVCEPLAQPQFHQVLSRFPGGEIEAPDNKEPPSRAYRKLLEAELHLGQAVATDESVVDLGASPGGWTYIALARGARVTAVDRSPLRQDLMAHPNLEFRKADAFKYRPDDPPVDWMMSDVVAFPQRMIELLDTWVGQRLCRRFVVTIKFRGQEDYPLLEAIKTTLRRRGAPFLLRRLLSNKNEVTAMGFTSED